MKKLISLFLMGVTALAATAAIAGDYAAQKVVYHVNYDDAKRQSGAMRNIQNHINAVGKENLDLRVVMHGKGVTLLQKANTDPDFKQKVDNLKDQGVKFNVCANTLRGKKIDYKTQLHDVDQNDIVPSGVAEIAKLEQEGFAYIRP